MRPSGAASYGGGREEAAMDDPVGEARPEVRREDRPRRDNHPQRGARPATPFGASTSSGASGSSA